MKIENEEQYQKALERILILWVRNPALESKEGTEFNQLIDVVIEYEKVTYPLSDD
jgi:antitoxin component HigA of HigAB toxin-antitoxin module